MPANFLDQLEQKCQKNWAFIKQAQDNATAQYETICTALKDGVGVTTSEDTVIVVFGSLARHEWTEHSDIDWTLLIDGQSHPEHRQITQEITKCFENNNFQEPGSSGTFGSMTFSHNLIHLIGGQHDTNINTTQRILLLLESKPLGPASRENESSAHMRVIRQIVDRYLQDDSNSSSPTGRNSGVPRFLLNDIVRFWRTMCVDFAYKAWEQENQNWALRNIKLRMSRKLIFASGLLICASNFINPVDNPQEVRRALMTKINQTPIEIVSNAVLNYAGNKVANDIFDNYNSFIEVLNDESKRTHLKCLKPEDAYKDKTFKDCRDISHTFNDGLLKLFLDSNERLTQFTREYGIF